VKQFLRGLLYAIAPQWTTSLASARARAHSQKVIASWGCGPITRKLIDRFGSIVQKGPFAGMILTPMTHAEQIGPCLLGVYESELDDAWDIALRGIYSQIVDVGAKFGYYAVGLAKRYPDASVVAFDTDWWARKATREMAAANGTRNVEVRGFCTPRWLARSTQKAALIISDCEGYEAVLFSPQVIPELRSATLIVETHDGFAPGVTDKLRAAFAETHAVQVYGQEERLRVTTQPLDFLAETERRLVVQEVRSPTLWLLCLPKTGPNQALHLTQSAASASGSPLPT
jgi:hypothetical protein